MTFKCDHCAMSIGGDVASASCGQHGPMRPIAKASALTIIWKSVT